MANGNTHDLITISLAVGAGVIAGSPVIAAGCLSGLMLSPDLDLPRCNARRRWRNVGLGWLWSPYARAIPHRSFWSHCPVVGTVGRLLYLGAALSPLIVMIGGLSVSLLVSFAVGLAVADTGHWVADQIG